MLIFKKAVHLNEYLQKLKGTANSAGFVPTMGALHLGHLSLIGKSKKENTVTVCSIFVNPTQFNDKKDFEKYPITTNQDIYQLEKNGTDVLFLPSVEEIYPGGTGNATKYELGFLENVLEGKFRPGHFQGVCQVMHRLLGIIQPDNLYLGQKDYQQCMVITKLIELMKTDKNSKVHICPTLREADGLAMSSRNMRLNKEERNLAPQIFKTLSFIRSSLKPGDLDEVKLSAKKLLEQKGFKVDYVEIADARSLELIPGWDGHQKLVALVAAFLDDIRLIDNLLLNP
jgi:pantoate--beta-alanine ligase